MARIIELIPGRSGKICTVKLKAQHGTVLSPVQRVYPLEIRANENCVTEEVAVVSPSFRRSIFLVIASSGSAWLTSDKNTKWLVRSITYKQAFQEIYFVDDPCVTDASKPCRNDRTAAILTLKQKEKGDWRNLTLEEKQALYYMSFSQPFCDVFDEPADEWKLILAGAFTTMGLMTLGMYLWLSQNVITTRLGQLFGFILGITFYR
ncbi:uncharacterized protein TNCV_1277312 [Trichonephila clavipes]|nr:uncharacterized protein TNCV_1277312 [Trichonephila clavipes]